MRSLLLIFLYSTISFAGLKDSHDLQISNFVIGLWQVSGGSCLSGQEVNWGVDFSELKIYLNFTKELKLKINVFSDGKEISTSSGSYSINDALLYSRITENCNPGMCEDSSDPEGESSLIFIQNDQLWLLTIQGVNGGSCGPQDVFILKLKRQ